ncbi:MAG: hypothetical protein ACE5HO_05080 [bacterium]
MRIDTTSKIFSAARLLTYLVGVLLVPAVFCDLALAQVTNDDCASATVVTSLPFTDALNTTAATDDPNDPVLSCGDGGGGKTVWYSWTPATDMFVTVNTFGSGPQAYDTVLGIFTGPCDTLVEMICNDDAGGENKSEILFQAQGGVTYIIHVAEWNGGGPNGGVPTGGFLVFNVEETTSPGLFKGPDNNSVTAGASVSTTSFSAAVQAQASQHVLVKRPIGKHTIHLAKNSSANQIQPTGPIGSNEVMDEVVSVGAQQQTAPNILSSFIGISDSGNVIPPDPHMAAGPNHIIATVNVEFGIFDKSGNKLFGIDANSWFDNVLTNADPFDPQIVYDHFDDRWVMVWVGGNLVDEAYYMLSVSDDSDPLGTWCNWALPAHFDGMTPSNDLNDYPKIGVDDKAIYVTANMFDLTTNAFEYVKLRIIEKTQLYNNTCGAVTWTDLWDLRDPNSLGQTVFTTIPAVTFGTPGVEYMINDSPYTTGTFMTLWTVNDPIGTPSLTAVNVPVVASEEPPDADQLGGSTTLIDVGGRRVRNAVYSNGSIWTAHSVAGGTGQAFAFARYVRIDVNSQTTLEDVSIGLDDFWHYYPAIQVDNNLNMVMGYTRSGLTEYAGAFFTGRRNSDPAGLPASTLLKAGEDNYVKTFSGTRNRWGDYSGIALDPSTGSIWMFLEYAAQSVGSGTSDDRWGTWFGEVNYPFVPKIVINEVVTSPQNDWNDSAGGNGVAYDNLPGTGTIDVADEWIELYNNDTTAVDLTTGTGWELIMTDATVATLNFATPDPGIVFVFSNGGSLSNFQPGEYLIIGNPPGDMEDNVFVELNQP